MALLQFANKKLWDPSVGVHSALNIASGGAMYKAMNAIDNNYKLDEKIIVIMDAVVVGNSPNKYIKAIDPSNYTPHNSSARVKFYKTSDNSIISGVWKNEIWITNGSTQKFVDYNTSSASFYSDTIAAVNVLTFTPSAYLAYSDQYVIEIDDYLEVYETVLF